MAEESSRLKLPLLAPGQAQKEMTHNEALARVDMLVQAVIEEIAPATIPTSPLPGQCWIVGVGATGAWSGHDSALACWTAGGWRFSPAFEGMAVWSLSDALALQYHAGAWEAGIVRATALRIGEQQVVGGRQAAIPGPAGGTTIDTEARVALEAVLAILRTHGLIAT